MRNLQISSSARNLSGVRQTWDNIVSVMIIPAMITGKYLHKYTRNMKELCNPHGANVQKSLTNPTSSVPLLWRHNGHYGVSNHQPHERLLNLLFRRRSEKTSKLRVTGLCVRNSPVNFPHKWPVTWKIFSFDDVIMVYFVGETVACLQGGMASITSTVPVLRNIWDVSSNKLTA